MGQTPGDDKQSPSLELPDLSLPGFGRRKKRRRGESPGDEPTQAQAPTAAASTPVPDTAPPADPAPAPDTAPPADTSPAPDTAPPSDTSPAPHMAPPSAGPPAAEPPRRRSRPKRAPLTAPAVSGRVAAAVTGVVVGAAGGAGTYGALAGCEAVRGVSTCGGAPGFFILVAILALMVLLGAVVLKAFRVEAAASTSFLAVGVVTVVAMLVLLDVIYSPWMFVVIPLLGAVSYLMAHWVTTRFDDEPTDITR